MNKTYRTLLPIAVLAATLYAASPAFAGDKHEKKSVRQKIREWVCHDNHAARKAKVTKAKVTKDKCDYTSIKPRVVSDRVIIPPISYDIKDENGSLVEEKNAVKVREQLDAFAVIPHNGWLEMDKLYKTQGEVKSYVGLQVKDLETGRIKVLYNSRIVNPGNLGLEDGRVYELQLLGEKDGCITASTVLKFYSQEDEKTVVETDTVYVPVEGSEPPAEPVTGTEKKCLAARVAELYFLKDIVSHTDADLTSRAGDLFSEQDISHLTVGGKLSGKNWRLAAEYLGTFGNSSSINSKGRERTADINNNDFTIEALGVNPSYNLGVVARIIFSNYNTDETSEVIVPDQNGEPSIAEMYTETEVSGAKLAVGPVYVAGDLTKDYSIISAVIEGIHKSNKNNPTELRIGDEKEILPYDSHELIESGWGYKVAAEGRQNVSSRLTVGAGASIENTFTKLDDGNDYYNYDMPPISNITTKKYSADIEALIGITRNIQVYGKLDYVKENCVYKNSGTTTETDSHGYEGQIGIDFKFPVGGRK